MCEILATQKSVLKELHRDETSGQSRKRAVHLEPPRSWDNQSYTEHTTIRQRLHMLLPLTVPCGSELCTPRYRVVVSVNIVEDSGQGIR